ncbi:MAG: HAD family hydrolase, partial [Polaromonas sp.]|nr:HAD family hydrolase [Polaromonas sp.]
SAAAAVWWWPFGPAHAMAVAVSVLIVTCPCALSLATPAAMLAGAGALARGGVLVRKLQALESCAGIDTVVFDKTGTLTEDRMDVIMAHTPVGVNRDEACDMAGALARHSLHPVSRAIAARFPAPGWVASEVEEVAGRGLRGKVARLDGSGQQYLWLGSASFCGAPVPGRGAPLLQAHLSDGEHYLAGFELDEAIRPDAARAAVPLAQAKADFIMTGNRLLTVPALLVQARRTRTIVRQNLLWAAIYNAACVPLAIVGHLPIWLAGIGMAASSLLVVANSARLARLAPEQ